jgi:DNA modification methylase
MPTKHKIVLGDARRALAGIGSDSVHLICTSPPYASLDRYPSRADQMGNIASYDRFLDQLDQVWAECLRILVPGGRIACVVGDVCVPRRRGGRRCLVPLSADIQVRGRRIGFDNLTPIRWLKVGNDPAGSTAGRSAGKANLPNGTVRNDLEHIVMLRKPGGYRSPTEWQEEHSRIETKDYMQWFSPIWNDVDGPLPAGHPAPFPEAVPLRLIRMFSFVGDWVVDPFAGTGTTAVAANATGRNSVMVEVEPEYVAMMEKRLRTGKLACSVSTQRHEPGTPLDLGLSEAAGQAPGQN